jgi:hypothetical protein
MCMKTISQRRFEESSFKPIPKATVIDKGLEKSARWVRQAQARCIRKQACCQFVVEGVDFGSAKRSTPIELSL